MSSDFEVKGADQFLRFSKALKQGGETEARKALHKGLRDVANRVKPNVAKALADALPSRLASKGAKVRQAVQVKTGADPGVSVVVPYGRTGSGKGTTSGLGAVNAQMINRSGKFRHPVYRMTGAAWVDQKVPAGLGWFDKGWTNKAPLIRAELALVLEQVADDIAKKAR